MDDGKATTSNTPEVPVTDLSVDRTPCPNCLCCWAFVCRDELWADWYGEFDSPDPPCPCETAPVPPPQPTEAGERFNRERNQALADEARKDRT